MIRRLAMLAAVSGGWIFAAGHAQAHITLTKPASWIQENATGDPQKSGPCGPAAGQGVETKAVTTYTEGQEITVEWTETVNHEGHFRIALAKDRSELKDPKITGACQSAEISDPPQYPVLADGLFAVKTDDGKRMFSQTVKLPAGMTCENCTLQVLQFMTPHPAPCLYYHCANIKIVAADAAGSGGTNLVAPPRAGAGGATPVAGTAAAAGRGGAAAAGKAGSPTTAAGAAGVAGVSAGTGAGGGSAGAEPAAGANPGPGTDGASPGSSSGCGVLGSEQPRNSTLAWCFGLGLLVAARRRHAARRV